MPKKVLAGALLLLSLLAVAYGVYRGEPFIVWSTGRILCLTCIGIK
jgi:hypothetical protein